MCWSEKRHIMLELTPHLIGFDWLQPRRVGFVLPESEAQPRCKTKMFYSFTYVTSSNICGCENSVSDRERVDLQYQSYTNCHLLFKII